MVDTSLVHMARGRLRERVIVFGGAAAEGSSVRQGKECIEVRLDGRAHGDGTGREHAAARCRVRNGRETHHSEALDQVFKRAEVEGPILAKGATGDTAELIPLKTGNALAGGIEVVFGVQGGVAMEVKQR